jgi:predicted AlkP superfamily pyrophosphatase or phosphodiesterase
VLLSFCRCFLCCPLSPFAHADAYHAKPKLVVILVIDQFRGDFVPGLYRELVTPVDIAATFASILGVNAPSGSVGRILTEALRPSPTGTGTH